LKIIEEETKVSQGRGEEDGQTINLSPLVTLNESKAGKVRWSEPKVGRRRWEASGKNLRIVSEGDEQSPEIFVTLSSSSRKNTRKLAAQNLCES
jgi:carbonic anhydrase